MSNPLEPRPDERIKDLESRVAALEERVALLAQGYSRMRHQRRRFWLRPPLWTFEQYTPRPLAENQGHQTDDLPPHPASIAIVTPSFNQCRFLPKTIESVLSQGYPNLIYRVQDAASTDGSVDVLRSYGSRMQWASEPDHGQAQAINRGFAQCRGEIMGYLNSDDALLPGTLTYVASMFAKYPEVDLVYGHRVFIDRSDLEIGRAILPRQSSKTLYWADFVPGDVVLAKSCLGRGDGARGFLVSKRIETLSFAFFAPRRKEIRALGCGSRKAGRQVLFPIELETVRSASQVWSS